MYHTIRTGAFAAAILSLGVLGAQAQNATTLASPDKASPAMKVATPDFAKAAMGSNAFEIRSSELAKEKAKSAAVKTFADHMIADHEKAGKGLKTALGDKDMGAAMLAPKQAMMLKQLEAASPADFEMLYVDMQAHGHMETVALFRTYAGNGDDAKVKAFTKETLPTLEMHTEMVQKLVASM